MSEEPVVRLVRELVENLQGADLEWQTMAMVLDFDGDRFAGTHGYVYEPSGQSHPVVSHPFRVRDAVAAYTESLYQPGDAMPVAVLVQFDDVSGRYEITFEDTDESRWAVTPKNFEEVPEIIRPKFD